MTGNIISDLDGVLFLGETPVAGAREALLRLEEAGHRLLFVTNNATKTIDALVEMMGSIVGYRPRPDQVLSSAVAAAHVLAGSVRRAYVVGERGLVDTLGEAGIAATPDHHGAGAVVVGLDRYLTYDKLRVATLALRAGARFIATNLDPTYPTPEGQWPGGGSLVRALEASSGRSAELAGKPAKPMRDLVRQRLAPGPVTIVGDRPDTDLAMGSAEGWRRVLVLTGVVTDPTDEDLVEADVVLDSIASLPDLAAAGS